MGLSDFRFTNIIFWWWSSSIYRNIESHNENKLDLEECGKVSFISCVEWDYETDAQSRKNFKVKDFAKNQLYTFQKILLEYYDDSFLKITIVLEGLVVLNIISGDVIVAKIKQSEHDFFWKSTI